MEVYLLIIFTILILLQLSFTLWLAVAVKTTSHNTQPNSVSVVIAAHNESGNLPALIEALKNQNHPDYEVIIVNDRSSDGTKDILSTHSSKTWLKTIHIDHLEPNWNGKKYALKKGIELAQNDVLLFTDADCLPTSSKWIELMTSGINDSIEVVLGFSNYKQRKGLLNQFIQFDTISTALQYLGLANKQKPYMAVGRNWAISKKKYPLSVLEVNSAVIGGDDDLVAQKVCHENNTLVQLQQPAFTSSAPEITWRDYLRQKLRHLSVGTKYSLKTKTLLAIYPLFHGGIWVILLVLLTTNQWNLALLIFGIRSLSFYIIFRRLGQKLDSNLVRWALPLVEFCYPFWYTFVGIRSLAAKHIEWKAENSFLIKH